MFLPLFLHHCKCLFLSMQLDARLGLTNHCSCAVDHGMHNCSIWLFQICRKKCHHSCRFHLVIFQSNGELSNRFLWCTTWCRVLMSSLETSMIHLLSGCSTYILVLLPVTSPHSSMGSTPRILTSLCPHWKQAGFNFSLDKFNPLETFFFSHENRLEERVQMCQKIIRRHLLKINPNKHLFYRVQQLGLGQPPEPFFLARIER